jgi:UDP:flavonoid glycosyltransferase YjiC (YdhE family)
MREGIAAHNALRAGVGAPPLGDQTQLYDRAPVFLYYTAEPFEYPRRDWPASYRLVGPGVWEPPGKSPAWLDAIEQPLVMVSCSSEHQSDRRLIEATLDALSDEDVFVVATAAGNDGAGFATPSNARVERYLPHAPLLRRAACVVCHGGSRRLRKAIRAATERREQAQDMAAALALSGGAPAAADAIESLLRAPTEVATPTSAV